MPARSRACCARPSSPATTTRPVDWRRRWSGPVADAAEGPALTADAAPAPGGHDYRRLLVTGGAGFIGSAYVRDVLARRDGTTITVLDKLTYAGNEANLAPVRADPEQAARLRFVQGDIADADV